jgi:phenylpropionate dioxygenase-like ring-hydroxylating dioxygenase large terminal subunit
MNKAMTLSDVMTSVNTAKGLPNAHYIDPDMFETEKKAVLFANWAGIGFGKDIPETGDAMPVDFMGMPLLMVRDQNGEIGVFQNTCRHRGMILVDAPQKIKGAIRCPYHSWAYTLQGDLRTAPHVGGVGKGEHEDINFDELGLIRFAAHVWRDVVFVNIDGTAAPFEEVHADLIARWKDFDQPMYHGGATSSFKLEVASNWKLAVENYCESYHLPWVHPDLNTISRLEDHYNIEVPGQYSGQGSYCYQQLKSEDGTSFPAFDKLSEFWDTGAEYVAIFPNVLLGAHCDHTYAILLEPKGLNKTCEHVEIYYARPPQETEDLEPLRIQNAAQWKAVFEEDIFVVEGMQRGRHGTFFDGGRFSPAMDGPTHCFHHWVASCVQRASED